MNLGTVRHLKYASSEVRFCTVHASNSFPMMMLLKGVVNWRMVN